MIRAASISGLCVKIGCMAYVLSRGWDTSSCNTALCPVGLAPYCYATPTQEGSDIVKRYAVRVEAHVEAEHPDAACEQAKRLMSPVQGAPWLVIFADGDKEQASQGTGRASLKQYSMRVQVYMEAKH